MFLSGRKLTLLICSSFTSVFLFISSFAKEHIFFSIGRCLTGFVIGGINVTFTYATEIVSCKHRSTSSTILFVSQAVGTIIGALLGMLVIPAEKLGWQPYQITISALFFFGFLFLFLIPESPRFLLLRGKQEKALKIIHSFNGNCNRNVYLKPLSASSGGSMKNLVKDPEYSKKLVVIFFVLFMVRLGKTSVGLLFLESLQNSNSEKCLFVTSNHDFQRHCKRLVTADYGLEMIMSLSDIAAALFSKPMADIFGRRKSLLIYGCFSAILYIFFFFCKSDLAQLFLALACRSILGSATMISVVYINELFPTSLRGLCLGIALFGSDIASAAAPIFVQYLSKVFYPATVSCLILSAAAWVILLMLFRHETKDSEQSDIVLEPEKNVSHADD